MKRIHIYFRKTPVGYKLIPGDRHIIRFLKKILFNKKKVSGSEKVYLHLCKGFDKLNVSYTQNIPFKHIQPGEPVIVLGDELYNGKPVLQGYNKPNAIIAGICLMTHPAEWPDLFEQYPVAKYLQHCAWANNLYIRHYGENRCAEWPAGIDTDRWKPDGSAKEFDVLIYSKIMWDREAQYAQLKTPLINRLNELGLTYREVTYGHYQEIDYFKLLQQCRSMIYFCEHETEGFALCEAMSTNIPVFAWDQGYCQDPKRFAWNDPVIETSSVPFFSENCGMTFRNHEESMQKIDIFIEKVHNGDFNPRQYILDTLTIKKSAERMMEIVREVYPKY